MSRRKKYRGHLCWVCANLLPNERFSGGGHARHVCRKCSHKPRAELDRMRVLDQLEGFLFRQRNISAGNVTTLKRLCGSSDPEVGGLARLVLDVAKVKPHKRRRMKFLRRNHPELFKRLADHLGWELWETEERDPSRGDLDEFGEESDFEACDPWGPGA